MRIWSVVSQKGGSGKTTLLLHVSIAAMAKGLAVSIFDLDPQRSAEQWAELRETLLKTEEPTVVHGAPMGLDGMIDAARDTDTDLVLIDTPPAVTKAIAEVVSFADLVILPTRPSPHDLRAVGPTIDICDAHKKQMIFALNAATPRARITMEAAVALSQHGTVAPVTIYNRTDFAASMIDGRTVMEIEPDGKSAEEVRQLWEYIDQRLMRMGASHDEASDSVVRAAPLFRNKNGLGRDVPAFGRRAN